MPQIKMVDLRRQYLSIRDEINEAIQSVLRSSEFIMGPAVREFEEQLCQYLGGKWTVGCASGTDALQIAMMALDIGPGDEVITSPYAFAATAEMVALLGARPVFVDIDSRTYNINVSQIADRITHRTRAIIPVHLYGQPADLNPILSLANDNGLHVIEDAAQAIGGRYNSRFVGTLGDIGCLSFYPSKNLGAYGDAGAILTNNSILAQKCRMITEHGSRVKYRHEILGLNSRLDSLQAAILSVKLNHLERWTESRIRIAHRYNDGLRGLELMAPYCAPTGRHVYHQYSIRTPKRDDLAAFLKSKGIACGIHYPLALHQQPAFKEFVARAEHFPVAEAVAKEILCLPIFPELQDTEIDTVINCVHEFFKSHFDTPPLPD
jgi:dTDP-4-amino-4,6-dideoxygalactose transaminase